MGVMVIFCSDTTFRSGVSLHTTSALAGLKVVDLYLLLVFSVVSDVRVQVF